MRTVFLLLALTIASAFAEPAESAVGMRSELRDVIIPGSELVAKPLEPGAPVVVRVLVARTHGDAFRYDLDYYGLEPGTFDLVDFLQPKDGSAKDEAATVPVEFTSALAADRITPNEPEAGEVPSVGGYKTWLVIIGVLWLAILLFLIFYRRSKTEPAEEVDAPPPSFADRLRPLVKAARDGELDDSRKAELERTLLGFWREKLDLADESPATALVKLRANPDASPLLKQLERWLHHPDPEAPSDVEALLAPYRDTPAAP
jgi:hypothetical protein